MSVNVNIDVKPVLCIIAGGGCAQIETAAGALKEIDRRGIKIDQYRGSSAGAFASALHASGITGEKMVKLIKETPVSKLFKLDIVDTVLRLTGTVRRAFYNAEGMADIMRSLTNKEGLDKVKVTVTREEDEEPFMTKATISSIMASGAIPLVFKAVRMGLKFFIDGGVTNMIPMPPVTRISDNKHMDYSKIFVILCPDEPVGKPPFTLLGKAARAFLTTMKRQISAFRQEQWSKLDNVVVIQPEKYPVDLMGWSKGYELVGMAEKAAAEALDAKGIVA